MAIISGSPITRNEQLKLAATAMNNVGVGAIVTGGFGPAAGYLVGVLKVDDPGRLLALFVVWTGLGIFLFVRAQIALRGMHVPSS